MYGSAKKTSKIPPYILLYCCTILRNKLQQSSVFLIKITLQTIRDIKGCDTCLSINALCHMCITGSLAFITRSRRLKDRTLINQQQLLDTNRIIGRGWTNGYTAPVLSHTYRLSRRCKL